MKQYIVDAFTEEPFSGNPAAVCVMDTWPSERSMMLLARENNFSETAFVVKERDGYRLRWFTPGTEVGLCGHATLASAFTVLNEYENDRDEVVFHTMSGDLTVVRVDGTYYMELPMDGSVEIPVTDMMEKAFGARPSKALLGLDLVCVFDDEDTVREIVPDQGLLMELPGRIQNVTALGKEYDCVSRSFCPKLSIPEDPVCGSAHIQIAAYWSEVLGKDMICAYQASVRGGSLCCKVKDDRHMTIGGNAVLIGVTEITADLP
ncbi:MAG: PhzF family phenazine biosynthesis protein [archaeon]|nr:PhzF family phenazine biosynthesis protein [archaeon]